MRLAICFATIVLGLGSLSCDSASEGPLQPQDVLVGTWVLFRVDEMTPTGAITRTSDFKRRVGEVKIKFDVLHSISGGNYTVEINAENDQQGRQIKGLYLPKTIRGEGNWGIQLTGPGGKAPYLNPGWRFVDNDHLVLSLGVSSTTASLQDWAEIEYEYSNRLEWRLLRE